jgi:hypothetical protein
MACRAMARDVKPPNNVRLRPSSSGAAAFAEANFTRNKMDDESWLSEPKPASQGEGWWAWGDSNSRHAV